MLIGQSCPRFSSITLPLIVKAIFAFRNPIIAFLCDRFVLVLMGRRRWVPADSILLIVSSFFTGSINLQTHAPTFQQRFLVRLVLLPSFVFIRFCRNIRLFFAVVAFALWLLLRINFTNWAARQITSWIVILCDSFVQIICFWNVEKFKLPASNALSRLSWISPHTSWSHQIF